MALETREANAHPRDSVFCGSIARMSCQHIEVTQKLPGECEPKEALNLKVSFGRLQGSQGARIYQYSRCFSTSNTLICSPPPELKGTANQFIIAHGNYLPSTNTILLTHKTQSEPQPPFHKLQFLHFIIPFFYLLQVYMVWALCRACAEVRDSLQELVLFFHMGLVSRFGGKLLYHLNHLTSPMRFSKCIV